MFSMRGGHGMLSELKVWGKRTILWKDNYCTVNVLDVVNGYRCSWHRHKQKYNLFYVITGELEIVTEEIDKSKKAIVLHPGESIQIKPGIWHEFRALMDTKVIEIMFVRYCEGDIERAILGGKISDV